MTPTMLIEAHEQFARQLDSLRRKCLSDFAGWLKSACRDALTVQAEAAERITAMRRCFAQEFIDSAAPVVIRSLNRDAERDILDALRSYEARFEPQSTNAPFAVASVQAFVHPWQPNLWRTAIGAAFGAVIGVVLLALGEIGAVPTTPTPPDASPGAGTPMMWLYAAFAAALGAAVGALMVACPPVHVLMQRMGLSGGLWSFARKFAGMFGGIFLLLRGSAVIVLAAVLLSACFGVLAWFMKDAKLSQIVLVVLALATILSARWTAPGERTTDTDALAHSLLDWLDRELQADGNVLAALSAALVLKRVHGTSPSPPALQEITNIIISRRQQHEPAEDILRIVEQNLRLRPGHDQPGAQGPAEFDWERKHEETFSTYGAIEIGDRVRVLQWPLFIEGPGGRKSVSQKGLVAPVI